MPFRIIRDNLISVHADALVNTANPNPVIGSGTDTAVYEAAGKEQLLEARRAIGVIAEGDAVMTPAFQLNAKIIIHAVSPRWSDGRHGETELLASCYRKAMEIACANDCASIAFPLLGAGSNGFPNAVALETALHSIQSFLLSHDLEVILVVFDRSSYELSSSVFSDVKSYIEEHQVEEAVQAEYKRGRWHRFESDAMSLPILPRPHVYGKDLGEDREDAIVLREKEDTFQARLFHLIDKTGESDPEVYKRANIDRKLFAKIRKDENYKPSRKTAIALALALKLPLAETGDLLSRAGYALSMSTTFDLIIRYCIEHRIYDIIEVNAILFQFDQELL